MTSFVRNALIGALIVGSVFAGVVIYAGKTVPVMLKGSKLTIDQFFADSQHHQPEKARTLFSSHLRGQLTAPELETLWRDFESKNGPITKWTPADSNVRNGARVCLWPRYADYLYRVYGHQGNRVFFLRVVPEGNLWRIERLNLMR